MVLDKASGVCRSYSLVGSYMLDPAKDSGSTMVVRAYDSSQ